MKVSVIREFPFCHQQFRAQRIIIYSEAVACRSQRDAMCYNSQLVDYISNFSACEIFLGLRMLHCRKTRNFRVSKHFTIFRIKCFYMESKANDEWTLSLIVNGAISSF